MPVHWSGSHSPKHTISFHLGGTASEQHSAALLLCSLEYHSLTERGSWPMCQGYSLPFLEELFLHSRKDLGLIFHLKDRIPIKGQAQSYFCSVKVSYEFPRTALKTRNFTIDDTVPEHQL